MLGKECLYEPALTMGGEDFGYMSKAVPGTFVLLGVAIACDQRVLHNPTLDIDESALAVGSAFLAETACRLLDELGT